MRLKFNAYVLFIFCNIFILTQNLQADEAYPFLSVGIGQAKVEIDNGFDNEPVSQPSFGYGFSVGYTFESNFLVQVGYTEIEGVSFAGAFDDFDLNYVDIEIGYKMSKNTFFLTPTIGYVSVNLDADEGAFFNQGEEDSVNDSDTNAFFGVILGFDPNKRFAIQLNNQFVNMDFGAFRVSTLNLTYKF